MKILRTRRAFENWRRQKLKGKKLGFVPTMGALHEGHLSLMRRSKAEMDFTVVSIFVNPTQFGPREDFKKYPRTESEDIKLLQSLQVDAVFMPGSWREIYPRGASLESRIAPRLGLCQILDALYRPGHFEGVATVVCKLFQIIGPDRAYFGQKDYQQLKVIEALAEDFFLHVRIVGCRTKRARSGLALSSRNRYLSEAKLKIASKFYETLRNSKSASHARRRLGQQGFKVQYVEDWAEDLSAHKSHGRRRRLAAVFLEKVRLIDNLSID